MSVIRDQTRLDFDVEGQSMCSQFPGLPQALFYAEPDSRGLGEADTVGVVLCIRPAP